MAMLKLLESLPHEKETLRNLPFWKRRAFPEKTLTLSGSEPCKLMYIVRISTWLPTHSDIIIQEEDSLMIAGAGYGDDDRACFPIRRKKGKGLDRVVLTNGEFEKSYILSNYARMSELFTFYLRFSVDPNQAIKCRDFWTAPSKKRYNYFFNNCATACYGALETAQIIPKGLISFPISSHRIVTPKSLYHTLFNHFTNNKISFEKGEGYLGLDFQSNAIILETPT